MIVCPRCSKDNQDHYKFCLGCGAELPRAQAAPKAAPAVVQPAVAQPVVVAPAKVSPLAATQQEAAPVAVASARRVAAVSDRPPPPASVPAPAARSAGAVRVCPACGQNVPVDFKFCGSCGQRMDAAPASAPSAAAPVKAPEPVRPTGSLVLINPDGSEGVTFELHGSSATVGRRAGGPFAADAYLSPDHATFSFAGGTCTVRDEGSLNGVYYKIAKNSPVPLEHGAMFRIGQEILVFQELLESETVDGVEVMGSPNPGFLGRLALVIGRTSFGNTFVVPPEGAHIGRERGDVIFPEDGYVSGLHCRVDRPGEGPVVLTDVGSSNGTFVRIQGEHVCAPGELLLMGQQLFRLQY